MSVYIYMFPQCWCFYSMWTQICFRYSGEFSLICLIDSFDPESVFTLLPCLESLTCATFRNIMYCKWISGCKSGSLTHIWLIWSVIKKPLGLHDSKKKRFWRSFFVVCRATGNVNWIVVESVILNHFLISGCCQSPAKEWPQKKEEKWRTEGASC